MRLVQSPLDQREPIHIRNRSPSPGSRPHPTHISGEKTLDTIWKELTEEFEEELQWLNITVDSLWNTVRERETKHPFTQSELKLITAGQTRDSVAQNRFWRLRPDGLSFRLPTKTSSGTLCILEFKRMSDVTDQYLTLSRS